MTDRRLTPAGLRGFVADALRAAGVDELSAEGTARALLHASLHGIDSHGVRLLPFYVQCLDDSLARRRPRVEVTQRRAAAAVVDADGGLGHRPSYRAMEVACALARDAGIGMAAVVNSTHFGAAGAYALAAAEAGFMGLVVANSGALVAPFDGRQPVHGTNPIAFAAPAAGRDPFLLDMATSAIPWNRVLLSRKLGAPLPAETALTPAGAFTEDAGAAMMLAPLGGRAFGYKGAGLAGMAETLSGALTGMRLAYELDGTALGDTDLGHLFVAVDPGVFAPAAEVAERVASYCARLAGMSGGGATVHPAGGPQWVARDDRTANGIPVPAAVGSELEAVAQRFGLAWPP
ncbi:MAG: oxidoreductase [Alphaproteobacteria bacterium]|nr:MAG: oxidoreductase [Alphaproteobacteria bacterium]